VFSKYAWTRALKNKKAEIVSEAMAHILNSSDGQLFKTPKLIQADEGKEFNNATFRAMLDEYNIKLYSTHSIKKAACGSGTFQPDFENQNVAGIFSKGVS